MAKSFISKVQNIQFMAKNKTIKKETPTKSFIDQIPNFGIAIILSAIAFLLYSNTFSHAFTMDDPLVITENKLVNGKSFSLTKIWTSSYLQGFNGVVDAAYRPISISQFAMEYQWFKGKSSGMHLMHVLYYCIGILLCYLFSFKLFKNNKWLAILTTLLFLSHPIHTEVVNNLKSRDEIMTLIGIFGMGYFYLKYLEKSVITNIGLAILFYIVALFSKESAVSYFLIIPFLYMWIRGQKWKNGIVHTSLFLGTSLIYLLIRTSVVGSYDIELDYMNNALVHQGGFLSRFPDAIMMMGKYIWMLIVPYPLSADYSFNSIPLNGWKSIYPYLSILMLSGLAYVGFLGFKMKNLWAVLVMWFFATIIVSSNILILIGSTFAERFLFVPSFAFAAGIIYVLHENVGIKSKILIGIVSVISLIYAGLTFQRNKDWATDYSLFSKDITHQSENARMQAFYGKFTHDKAKEIEDKEKEDEILIAASLAFEKATTIAPDYMVAHHYRGFLAKDMKNFDLAESSFSEVLKLEPNFKTARQQLAYVYSQNGKYELAIGEYLTLIESGMQDASLISNLGYCYYVLEEYQQSEKYYLQAYSIDPSNKNLLSNMIKLYRDGLKDMPNAIKYNDILKNLE